MFEHESKELGKSKSSNAGGNKVPEKKNKKEGEHKKIAEMHIKKAKGGYMVTHKHEAPHHMDKHDEHHMVPVDHEGDVSGLHNHIEQHLGAMNEGESELAPGVAPAQPAAVVTPQATLPSGGQ